MTGTNATTAFNHIILLSPYKEAGWHTSTAALIGVDAVTQ